MTLRIPDAHTRTSTPSLARGRADARVPGRLPNAAQSPAATRRAAGCGRSPKQRQTSAAPRHTSAWPWAGGAARGFAHIGVIQVLEEAPVRFAREMGAELVIAVDITSVPDGNPTGDPLRMLLQTFAIMGRSINQFELREADVVLTPRLPGVSSADFASHKRSIQAGRDAALAALAELRSRIAAKTK